MPIVRRRPLRFALLLGSLLFAALACARSDGPLLTWRLTDPWVGEAPGVPPSPTATPTAHPLATLLPPTRRANESYRTPTPDPVRPTPQMRTQFESYVVQPGDSLNQIAFRFGVGADRILAANGSMDPDLLAVGQVLAIPPPGAQLPGPGFKIIPDSELVYSPGSIFYAMHEDIARWNGALAQHREEVEGVVLSGAEIVQLVAQRYSVNPRLLVALLEYQSGWLTRTDVASDSWIYQLGFYHTRWQGLFGQLSWAADQLNAGFYLWQAGWQGPFIFPDGAVVVPGPGLNAGTVGVQYFFAQLYPVDRWRHVVGEDGFHQVYKALFGFPFDWAIEPLLPAGLVQPALQLPFEAGAIWSYTGGPHGGWGNGSGWAALDFAPPGDALGCVFSNAWITAISDGLVLRSENGEVVVDLDGDGYEQTGWVVLYMHVESRDRVPAGAWLQAGDRIGHPSCEGGVSSGTHLHLARKYNGAWIPADGALPFVMDGWQSQGSGRQYDGTLSRGGIVLEACSCRTPGNQISR